MLIDLPRNSKCPDCGRGTDIALKHNCPVSHKKYRIVDPKPELEFSIKPLATAICLEYVAYKLREPRRNVITYGHCVMYLLGFNDGLDYVLETRRKCSDSQDSNTH